VENGDYSHWLNIDFRIKPAAKILYPSTSGADIGADVDEIAHWQGTQHGERTISGLQPFFEESRRRMYPINNGIRLKYDYNGSNCAITIYSNTTYATAVVTIANDSAYGGYSKSGNIVTMNITGLTNGNRYIGKRICGSHAYTDVFPAPELTFKAGL
jgi:hypothetical protein